MHDLLARVTSLSFRLWLVVVCFEGILRYYLGNAGLGSIVYARDIFLVAIVTCAIVDGVIFRNQLLFLFMAMLLTLAVGVGTIAGARSIQIIFGLKVLLPLITGLMVGCSTLTFPPMVKQAAAFCVICILGVLLTSRYRDLPWTKGNIQEVMGTTVVNSREWSQDTGMGGDSVVRSAGFSRASFAAATQILFLGIIVFSRTTSPLRWLIWSAALLGIVATTSKGVIVAWLACTLASFSRYIDGGSGWIRNAMLGGIFLLLIGTPCLIFFETFDGVSAHKGTVTAFLTDSFVERLNDMWPRCLAVIQSGPFGGILGRGIGVGIPATYFQPEYANPGDNLFVFLAQLFGVLAFPLMLVTWIAMNRLNTLRFPRMDNETIWLAGLFAITYGIFANIIEDPMNAICLGCAIGRGLSRTNSTDHAFALAHEDHVEL